MSVNETDFKLIDKIIPPVTSGEHSFIASQTVTLDEKKAANYTAELKYAIAHTAFTLRADEVFEIYPANGEAGCFDTTLPYITFNDRCLPWTFGGDSYLALLVLKNDEIIGHGDISVGELFKPVPNTYFPDRSAFPSIYAEEQSDFCSYIDISSQTYADVFPPTKDIPLLAHAKLIDLSKSPDAICGKDGYFSVILANRFVPSDDNEETVSSCHLVTTFGYGGNIPKGYEKVRLVSLYNWSIRSHKDKGMPFKELIEGLSKNFCEIGRNSPGGDSVVKPHYTRTGEMTYSIYHSPLTAGENREIPQMSSAHTADGRLIYDKKTGIFDVSYAAAFQLGRLITLSRKDIAEKVLNNRNDNKMRNHKAALDAMEKADVNMIGGLLLNYAEKLQR